MESSDCNHSEKETLITKNNLSTEEMEGLDVIAEILFQHLVKSYSCHIRILKEEKIKFSN